MNEPLLLLAAFCSILLATVTLVALTMYASSTAEAGVRRAIETVPVSTKAAVINAPVSAATFDTIDTLVRDQVRTAYAGVPVDITLSAVSSSYVMPGQERRKTPELLVFGVYDTLDQHAKLIAGAWPSTGGSVVEAAVSQPVASTLGLSPGQLITTENRVDHQPVRVRISGVFQLDDPFADRWSAEPLLVRGTESVNYTTHGPLMVPRETFATRFSAMVSPTWLAVPDLRPLPPDRLRAFAAEVGGLRKQLVKAGCDRCAATSKLPDVLIQLTVATLVARSTMLIPVLQLMLLAAYALMLTARLLADHRRMEVALLRARGAGTVRLALLSGAEALLLALPCAAVAPLLGPPLLKLAGTLPWIQASGVRLAPTPDAGTFAVSFCVALASAILLALPAIAGARRTYVDEQTARARRGLLQRAGADVVLLGVAGLAIWQLQHYGAPVTATAGGELGIDPLIVSGPALALLTGGLLGLRLVPRISKLAERLTSKRRGLTPALGSWQVSRRPLRYAGPALLLTMAIAIGVVSLAMTATWRASQADQARHQAGTDLRITDLSEGRELGVFGRGAVFAALPGVTSISAGHRGLAQVGGKDATLLALDAAELTDLLRLRADLSGESVETMAATMLGGRPAVPLLPVPGERLRFDLTLSVDAYAPIYEQMRTTLTLVDGLGVWREFPIGPLKAGVNRIDLDLGAMAGRSGKLAGPISLRGFRFDVPLPALGSAFTVQVDGLPEARWAHRAVGSGGLPKQTFGERAGGFTLAVAAPEPSTDSADPKPLVVLLARESAPDAPLPVVITRELATVLKLSSGQVTAVQVDGRPAQVRIAAIVDGLPSTSAERPAVLLDLPTLQARENAAARPPKPVTEWWAATANGQTAAALDQLRRKPEWSAAAVDLPGLTAKLRDDPLASGLQGALMLGFGAAAVDLPGLTVKLRDDPLASGLQGALMLGFGAALVFAALGFLVSVAVSARERAAEFAVLRALGASFRQVLGLLAVEQSFVIGLSVVAGTVLAVVVGSLVVPHIVLTGQASAVIPGVLYDVPWAATTAVLAGVTALLFAIVAALARRLRRQDTARVLRAGEER